MNKSQGLKSLRPLAIFTLILAAGAAACLAPQSGLAAQGREIGTMVAEAAKKYACPMHPMITSDKPDNCSICGMKLEPVAKGK